MTITINGYNEISILPWLSLNEIKVGDVIFWKFDSSVIKDPLTKAYLEKYVQCYVDIHGKSLNSVVIASYKDKNNFLVLDPVEQSTVKAARDLLCFASIAPHALIAVNRNNNSIAPPSSERFQLFSQNFIPGTDDIAFRSGSHSVVTSGAWKLNEVKLSTPLYLGGSLFSTDGKTLSGLVQILPSLRDPEHSPDGIRLLRAIEWFRLAHVENDEVSIFSKVVMMSTAFEILFSIPNLSGKSEYLAKKIDNIFGSPNLIKDVRKIGKTDTEHTLAGWFGWDFYKLRNRVVHGDTIDSQDLIYKGWLTYLIIADLIFLKAIIKELYSMDFYAEDIKDLFDKSVDRDGEEEMLDFVTGFSGLYERLDWKTKI
ncbi:hypothetical protein COV25_04225 [candidate division WWE3 bacterium CG10_big_fil_rev_8_21_14_0_10_35_32]|nr:MAG: hypothetical protein COV25_04225 [candidate division WWE3 bacterium CG10_big_fil_rev_8_21_14_0_10_35_32]